MGELIILADRRTDRSRPCGGVRPVFFFDLACPFSYLAAERVERMLGEVDWVPAAGAGALWRGDVGELQVQAERRAAELRLPLVWPDRFPSSAPGALRAAANASHQASGSRFALAAARLAFCGGFDIEDPEVLAEAAAAAGVSLAECLTAASDTGLDAELEETARGLSAKGVRRLPAFCIGRRFFDGEHRLSEVAALVRAHPISGAAQTDLHPSVPGSGLGESPLAPVG
jgi:2-hydroxychromene-2-carboxylate isomerase